MAHRTAARVFATLAVAVALVIGSAAVLPAQAAPSKGHTLKHNKLYKTKPLHSAGCAPQSAVPLDNATNLLAYYQSVLPCLNAAWDQAFGKKLRKAGYKFRAPKLVVHDGTTKSPCGAPLTISYYCTVNRTIYMYAPEIVNPWNQYPTDYSHGLTKLAATHTLAHEYGHHVQHLVGIFKAIGNGYSGRTERRAELQASCLGNVFLSSQREVYPIGADYGTRPDLWRYITVANHGSIANQQYWTERGYSRAKPGDCNTFKAPKTKVS